MISYQIHTVPELCDISLTGLDDSLDIVDTGPKIGKFTLQFRLLLHM